jgi:hypothetical protein
MIRQNPTTVQKRIFKNFFTYPTPCPPSPSHTGKHISGKALFDRLDCINYLSLCHKLKNM